VVVVPLPYSTHMSKQIGDSVHKKIQGDGWEDGRQTLKRSVQRDVDLLANNSRLKKRRQNSWTMNPQLLVPLSILVRT